ncbi:unnamed protein product [Brassica rapa]|uniref:Uncharacterized protein n=2 Tax=Brassica campestris TaxID=3711 RepID=A0A3P5Z4W0_BRACM|nr:unnamed protein product [Brassica rapa]VDC70944.1 unnamed protein product [Brassica rapa]
MSEEGPKLFTNKPKKKGKMFKQTKKAVAFLLSFQLTQRIFHLKHLEAYGSTMSGDSVPPPPQPPKESFARRYKYVWPLLLTVNLAAGGYLFLRPKKKDIDSLSEEIAAKSDSAAAASVTMAKPAPSAVVAEPVVIKAREPIPEKQQRELFKWILEEKRKVKPRNAQEKKRIDQEKAILKQFIGSKTIPTL